VENSLVRGRMTWHWCVGHLRIPQLKGKRMKINKTVRGTGPAPVRLAGGAGAIADRTSKLNELYRTVLACMLFEDTYYEGGESVSQRIAKLVPDVAPDKVASLAMNARGAAKLRSVPLFLVREMARHDSHKPFVATTLEQVIQRADELAEFVALYWKEGKQPLANSVKKGLARAFTKFDEYALSKYNRDNKIKLRDVLFLCHAKPVDKKQEKLWKRLIDDKLKVADTWETALSATQGDAENKKEAWERLLSENKLGVMALLRNLRNFEQTGVDRDLVKQALKRCKTDRVLPFRFITAVKHAPRWQAELEDLMLRAVEGKKALTGKTVVVIDVSGSMGGRLSGKTEMSRMECAASLCILLRELCEDVVFYATAGHDGSCEHKAELVRPHRGFALRDAILESANRLGGGGIFLKQVMDYTRHAEKKADRVIVITDEADTDKKANPQTADAWGKRNYIINISVEKGGVAFKKFNHINGFSEAVIDYLAATERLEDTGDFAQALKYFQSQ
jgi:60 kDa SS-A/Ro ribonucleoprotein